MAGPAPTDYVFSTGATGVFTCGNPFVLINGAITPEVPSPQNRAFGPFGVNSSVKIDMIRDGTSNTILMGESVGGAHIAAGTSNGQVAKGDERLTAPSMILACDNPWSQGYIGTRVGAGGLGSVFGATAFNANFDAERNLMDPDGGANWFPYPLNEGMPRMGRATWAASSRPQLPVRRGGPPPGAKFSGDLGSCQGFRGYHRGGVNFLLGDGSMRLFSQSIDAKVLAGFSTIMGREPLGEQ
jgi:hypothetical protein